MSQFVVNSQRHDPYKQFKFRVKWDGRYVAGVDKISALRRVTDVVAHREGGDPSSQRKSPGLTAYEPITLERGKTHDLAFESWASKVWSLGASLGIESSLKDFRKDIVIELLNEAGQVVIAYKVYRCWPSEYTALCSLDASSSSIAFETMVIQHEGWERDVDVLEPAEPITG